MVDSVEQKSDHEVKDMIYALDKKIDIWFTKMEPIITMVEKHDRILVRQNGKPALVDTVEDQGVKLAELIDAEKKRKAQEEENIRDKKKFYWVMAGTVFAAGLDIFLRLIGIV